MILVQGPTPLGKYQLWTINDEYNQMPSLGYTYFHIAFPHSQLDNDSPQIISDNKIFLRSQFRRVTEELGDTYIPTEKFLNELSLLEGMDVFHVTIHEERYVFIINRQHKTAVLCANSWIPQKGKRENTSTNSIKISLCAYQLV